MSSELLLRGFFSAIFSIFFAWIVFSRFDSEIGDESAMSDQQRYLPYLPPMLLPAYFLLLAMVALPFFGFMETLRLTLSMCFDIFLHISVYYLILLVLMPYLRKWISSRACAMLWIIPNYLYYMHHSGMEVPNPVLVIHAPGNWIWIIMGIWLVGFAAVLLWKMIEHLVFRHHILQGAQPVEDAQVLSIWQTEVKEAAVQNPKFKLVISPAVSTPLSIGFFRRTIRVVLPDRNYNPSELKLIFRHEIIHICREDSSNKFFLLFCSAMCWFNPLMWTAMRRSANDLELSCDETVLLGADDETRWKYANLLLRTAGDEKGFTTCLSATASALRYRLENVVNPRKVTSGAIVVCLIFFILFMTSGYIALAYGGESGAELIYQNRDTGSYSIGHISMKDDAFSTIYQIADEEAFHRYLSDLTLCHLTGNYSFSGGSRQFTYLMSTPEGIWGVSLFDNAIKLSPTYGDLDQSYYYIHEGIDWEYISSVIIANPAMNVRLKEEGDPYGDDITGRLEDLWKVENGLKTHVYNPDYPTEDLHGIFGSDLHPYEAEFTFSYPLSAPIEVLVENWDRSESYTVTQKDIKEPFRMELPDYSAHYTVCASFNDQSGGIYEAVFRFSIGELNNP